MVTSIRLVYTILWYFFLPRVFLRLYWRSRLNPGYRHGWLQRLGIVKLQGGVDRIWIHAVSVGEVRAAVPLIEGLCARYPDLPLVVTTTTPTGATVVGQQFADRVSHSYLPFDIPTGLQRFLQRVSPVLVIIMETELWPNLLRALRRRKVPCILANARLSERAFRRYRWLGPVMRSILQDFNFIAAQTAADAQRFIALGADADRVAVLGNMKYDLAVAPEVYERGAELRRMLGEQRAIWVAASTHAGEEAIMARTQALLRRQNARSLLVLVPRHPERAHEVYELCQRAGLQVRRRSASQACEPGTDVYLVDTVGELPAFYAAADLAVIGGSFVPVGGHNPLEPASLNIPIITGPERFNFAAVFQQLEAEQAALCVADEAALLHALTRLFDDRAAAARMAARAVQVLKDEAGAVERLLQIVSERLAARIPDPPPQLPQGSEAGL